MKNKWTLNEVKEFCREREAEPSRNTYYNWSMTLRDTGLVEKEPADHGGDELLFSPAFALLMIARARHPNKYLPGKPLPEKVERLLGQVSLGREIEDDWLGLQYVTPEDVWAAWETDCPHWPECVQADCEIHGDDWIFCKPVGPQEKENEDESN